MNVEYVKRNNEARSPMYFRSGKTLNIAYFECVCRLKVFRMQCSCAILSSVACLTVLYFSTLSHKLHEVREYVIERKLRVLIYSTNLSKHFTISRITERDVIKYVYWISGKLPLILVRFQWSM